MPLKKIKAGALQITLYVAIVIMLLLFAFLLILNFHKKNNIKSAFFVESIKNSSLGVVKSLNNEQHKNDTIIFPLGDEDYKTLKTFKNYWGLYERVYSVSKVKNFEFSKIALIGYKQPENNKLALNLTDNNKPLLLVGNTKIKGKTLLPKQGVKSGYISGMSYFGNHLIDGNISISNSTPPKFYSNLSRLVNENKILNIDQNRFIDLNASNELYNSFKKPYQVVYDSGTINLINKTIVGHIYIISKTKIIVGNNTLLKDVVLIAPKIEVEDNKTSNFQAIAKENIRVNSGCKLNYPSVLAVFESKTNQNNEPSISILGDSEICGSIIYNGIQKNKNYTTQVFIDNEAKLYGQLLCNQNLELNGSVYGTVYSNNFITKHKGSIYQNHLFNAEIDASELDDNYTGLNLINSSNNIVQWLY